MERTKRFFQRHRRGFAITAVVVGAGYLAYTYIREKVKEVNEATATERSDQEKSPPQLIRRKLTLQSASSIYSKSTGLYV